MNRPWEMLDGEALANLKTLPDGAFQTCVTSPPYHRLRSYLPKGHPLKALEYGQEECPDCFAWARGVPRCGACFVCKLTDVFAQVKRVLRDDGTLWVNLSGSYAAGVSGKTAGDPHRTTGLTGGLGTPRASRAASEALAKTPKGWKQKDYINTPAYLAESLRADGWYLRAEIALTKVAPMPESCRDRPTRATEKLYLFAKKAAYYYDMEAERGAGSNDSHGGGVRNKSADVGNGHAGLQTTRPAGLAGRNLWDHWDSSDDDLPPAVWPWRPEPSRIKHYATFPLWLPLRAVRLGTSAMGCCAECGAPRRRVLEKAGTKQDGSAGRRHKAIDVHARVGATSAFHDGRSAVYATLGWRPSCGHDAPSVPCAVLDCFSGTATTGVAARLLGRSFVGIELNPEYAALARARLADAAPLDDAAFSAAPTAPPPEPSLFPEPPASGDGRRRLARFVTRKDT